MTSTQQFQQLLQGDAKTELSQLDALFDTLPAISEAAMLGEWTGGVFRTGHPGERQLAALQWGGKTFRSRDDVDPIVSVSAAGERSANPIMGAATLRMVEYRGVVTATMVYDQHPVMDHFRQVDDTTVLGVMIKKGDTIPLYFYLQR